MYPMMKRMVAVCVAVMFVAALVPLPALMPQTDIANQMAKSRGAFPFDFVITLGDNIYTGNKPADFDKAFRSAQDRFGKGVTGSSSAEQIFCRGAYRLLRNEQRVARPC